MKGRIARLLLQAASTLPLAAAQAAGVGLGTLLWLGSAETRRVARRNLELCLPQCSVQERDRLAYASTRALGAATLEAPVIWRTPAITLQSWLVNPEALSPLLEIQQQGNGLIVAAPHLGSWEFLGVIIGSAMPITSLFKPPRLPQLDAMVRTGRQHTGATLVPTDSSGVKSLSKALRQGHATGILPDQEPARGNGVFADFFGQPAYTMPLLPKLAQKRQIPVAFAFAERLPRGQGFKLHVRMAGPEFYNPDSIIACNAMNRQVEELIRLCPEQYNWAYKRFRKHPEGLKRYSRDFAAN